MSVSLENIWSEPLINSPPRPSSDRVPDEDDDTVFRPTKRRRSSLFLDDLDASAQYDNTSFRADKSTTGAEGKTVIGIDALFADLEEPGDNALLSKPFNLSEVRHQARLRAEKNVSAGSLANVPIESSSPTREGMELGDDYRKQKDGKGLEGNDQRKRVARLDETRILGKDGLPALVQLCKDFKPKGKGHELSDLNRLFSIYQLWAHKMYPKYQFKDTIDRVEKLCYQRRLHIALSVWRDEANGIINSHEDKDEMLSNSGDQNDEEEAVLDLNNTILQNAELFEAAPRPSSSALQLDVPMDDDTFDFEGLLAEEEDIRHDVHVHGAAAEALDKTTAGGFPNGDEMINDDGSEIRTEIHGHSSRSSPHDDEDDAWDIIDEYDNAQRA